MEPQTNDFSLGSQILLEYYRSLYLKRDNLKRDHLVRHPIRIDLQEKTSIPVTGALMTILFRTI